MMEKPTMENMGREAGYSVALASGIILLLAGILSVTMSLIAAKYMVVDHRDLNWIFTETPFPFLVQAAWFLLTLGIAGCAVAVAVYWFRARWFWRCMIVGCCLLLLSPSIHALAGAIGLVVLIVTRSKFPISKAPPPAMA